ncbi:MAG: hypothetical protein N2690_09850, partial [Rhodocyclaceae bacterium]|nr:hypothetical protein [Rhodocyclaceae bacterium]
MQEETEAQRRSQPGACRAGTPDRRRHDAANATAEKVNSAAMNRWLVCLFALLLPLSAARAELP